MLVTENQRIKIFRESLNMSQLAFATELGMKQGSISDIERGRNSVDGIVKLCEVKFNLNIDWLKSGEGNMYKSEPSILSEPLVEYKVTQIKAASVPVYDIEFAPGVMSSLIESGDEHYPVGYLGIPELQGCDAVIRAKGDGMDPKINDGDWLGVKRIDNWKDWLPMGHIYAVYTDNFELVRYLEEGGSDETFTIMSHNKFYRDQEIPKSLIREVWSVKAILPFSNIETLI